MSQFPCTSCGLCCRIVGHLLPNIDEVKDPINKHLVSTFPYKTKDGVCEMLKPDNTCAVYNDRPDLCNINTVAKLRGITDLNEYHKLNAQICNSWIQLSKSDPSYLIDLTQFDNTGATL